MLWRKKNGFSSRAVSSCRMRLNVIQGVFAIISLPTDAALFFLCVNLIFDSRLNNHRRRMFEFGVHIYIVCTLYFLGARWRRQWAPIRLRRENTLEIRRWALPKSDHPSCEWPLIRDEQQQQQHKTAPLHNIRGNLCRRLKLWTLLWSQHSQHVVLYYKLSMRVNTHTHSYEIISAYQHVAACGWLLKQTRTTCIFTWYSIVYIFSYIRLYIYMHKVRGSNMTTVCIFSLAA